MVEYVSAYIRLCAVLPHDGIETLFRIVSEDGAGPAWGRRFVDEVDLARDLQDGATGVVFYGDAVRNSDFERLKAFCDEQNLTYLLA